MRRRERLRQKPDGHTIDSKDRGSLTPAVLGHATILMLYCDKDGIVPVPENESAGHSCLGQCRRHPDRR